jgi:hypothetical protein
MLENQPGQKNEKGKKIKDGLQGKFRPKRKLGFKSKVLNISKPNLNWIQNRIKSNQLFGNF